MKTIRKMMLIIVISILIGNNYSCAQNSSEITEKRDFITSWIGMQPEVLTYKVKNKKEEGLLQVSIVKTNDTLEVFTNIMTPDFMKIVWGKMTKDMKPVESISRIVINKRIMFDTECNYTDDNLKIETTMKPYGKIMKENISFNDLVIDFSQIALLVRTLSYTPGQEYLFNSLNPQKNKLVPLSIKFLNEEIILDINCNKIEKEDFEGHAFYWIEKRAPYRVIRIEQPKEKQVTELIL
jgi:hypothetical protein